jgi:hypothetical protein
MKLKAIAGALALTAAAVGGYWYYSPHLALKSMQTAAQEKDADKFNEHVDYPKLRESFKGQMSAMMAEQLGKSGSTGAEAWGAMLGAAMANQFVDALVRPEVVMKAMQSGEFNPKAAGGSSQSSENKKPSWTLERKGTDKVIAYGTDPTSSDKSKALGVVFERYGFADWKLTEVRFPASRQ